VPRFHRARHLLRATHHGRRNLAEPRAIVHQINNINSKAGKALLAFQPDGTLEGQERQRGLTLPSYVY
jgi:hypothetical protein